MTQATIRRAVLGVLLVASTSGIAADLRVLPADERPKDRRLEPLKDLNGYFPFDPPASREAWEQRAEVLRRQLRVALGLWPMPVKTPLEPVIHGRVDRPEYTVEKVYFQSYPGHFVTGNLYRPKGKTGRLPAVLSPHGHWANGRFHDHGPKEIAKELASGGEKFERGGRHPLQARCVQLARMGCVVFHYDMVGYADSIQIEHRPGVRQVMNTAENWGFFSPQAELRLQSMMGLQTYNSIRALDFLESLPDVDPQRIGVTGASGGGTQTFILCAIDPRPKVAFPAVMVSTAMQGGCTCENCNFLRVETGNVEIAALFAPKPLAMSAANDWTKEIASKGLPQLKQLYALFGADNLVHAAPFLQFGHNYNYVSRAVMYDWMNRHLDLHQSESLVETDYQPLSIAEMSVWNENHPRPPHGDDYERSLVKYMTDDSDKQVAAMAPTDALTLATFREMIGGAWKTLLGSEIVSAAETRFEEKQSTNQLHVGLVQAPARGVELPVAVLYDEDKLARSSPKRVVIWLTSRGKDGLFESNSQPIPQVQALVDAGCAVVGVDLLYQGEFLKGEQTLEQQPMAKDALVGYAGYTYGYNYPLFSQRVQDILTLLAFRPTSEVELEYSLVGLDDTGPLAVAAAAVADDRIKQVVVDTAGFRFADLTEVADPNFLPGAAKYGDIPALLALCAGKPIYLAGEGSDAPQLLAAAARSANALVKLQVHTGSEDVTKAAVDWLQATE